MNTNRSHVNSNLARTETLGVAQCEATWVLRSSAIGHAVGDTIRCERPASKHRVHEALGYVQWAAK